MSPKKPISEFIVIMNKEVPTAFFIGNLANKTKDGIIRNPPPAPINPTIYLAGLKGAHCRSFFAEFF